MLMSTVRYVGEILWKCHGKLSGHGKVSRTHNPTVACSVFEVHNIYMDSEMYIYYDSL